MTVQSNKWFGPTRLIQLLLGGESFQLEAPTASTQQSAAAIIGAGAVLSYTGARSDSVRSAVGACRADLGNGLTSLEVGGGASRARGGGDGRTEGTKNCGGSGEAHFDRR